MSHREREIVPDRGTSEGKSVLSLKFLASVWNLKYALGIVVGSKLLLEMASRSREVR